MITCDICGYPHTHPLGITFDDKNICSGCITHHEKYDLKWYQRSLLLKNIVSEYKGKYTYDCIVPVTGGGDSYYTVFYVKYVLKLNPLCVHYNSLYMNRIGHRNLSNLRSQFNVDIHTHIPSLEQVRELNRATLYSFNSMYWHVHAGTTSLPVQIALKYRIPLIIWGSHEAVEQVGMYSHDDQVEMTARYREDHHLMGTTIDSLEKNFMSLKKFNNAIYSYPSYSDLNQVGIRGIYLSNYIPWNQKLQQEFVASKFKFKQRSYDSLFNGYEHPYCAFYNGIHDWLKYLKHGYGRLLDHLVREVRWKRINQYEMAAILSNFNPAPPNKNIKLFREFMDISSNSFDHIFDFTRSKGLFPAQSDRSLQSMVYSSILNKYPVLNVSGSAVDKKLRRSFSRISSLNTSNLPHILLNGFPY